MENVYDEIVKNILVLNRNAVLETVQNDRVDENVCYVLGQMKTASFENALI